MNSTSLLKVNYDAVHYAAGNDIYEAWNAGLTDADTLALEEFVTSLLGSRSPAKFVEQRDGSYNRVMRFSFDSASGDVALKFPKPGHSDATFAVEKLANEAAWMQFLREKTTIPVPYLYSHGDNLTPLRLPYIMMDWVAGDDLRQFLQDEPSDDLRYAVYRQLASFYLQLWRLPCEGIGTYFKDSATGPWRMRRPLTMDMHQFMLGIPHYLTEDWPTGMFTSCAQYFDFLKKQQWNQLWTLRNLNEVESCVREESGGQDDVPSHGPEDIARLRYEARFRFQKLLDSTQLGQSLNDLSPFRAFNPDFDTRNMTVDPATGQVTGVFDLEFNNSMPAQFACDPPLSLFKVLPGVCLDQDFFPWFLSKYEAPLAEFLEAMKREEETNQTSTLTEKPLSTLMRESWDTKRVWFNYALNHTDHLDTIYWAVFHTSSQAYPNGIAPDLPVEVKAEIEEYVLYTKTQLVKYEDSWEQYFRDVDK